MRKTIRNWLEDKFNTSEEWLSFKALKAGTDHLFIIKQILHKIYDKMKENMIFIDLEKAYDNFPKKLLWKAMKITNISKPVINLVKLIYKTNTCQIKKEFKISEGFKSRKGLLWKCCTSPTLFKIYMGIALKVWSRLSELKWY